MELRDYQKEAVKSFFDFFGKNPDANPLIIMPTGTGKSVVIAAIMKELLAQAPHVNILCLTHVKELILQNYLELLNLWDFAPAGVWSAGLNRKDKEVKILFAGIQSIANCIDQFKKFDLVFVDEAHLIPNDKGTQYRTVLDVILKKNPNMRVVGFTATPFRLSKGNLYGDEDSIFDTIAFEVKIIDMIERGFLCEVIPKEPKTTIDIDSIGIRGGEFKADELNKAVDKDEITAPAVAEIVSEGATRKSWLLFCSGVEHSIHVRDEIRSHGITCESITGDTPSDDRAQIIADFKSGKIKSLTNANVLTTGFNAPSVDLIALLRPTKSAGLYIQMVGRGTRLAPQKQNCLVLDFAGNTQRFGAIDHIDVRVSSGNGEAPTKTCPECKLIMFAGYKTCKQCNYVFPVEEKPKFFQKADTSILLSSQIKPRWWDISSVDYARHSKDGKPPSLKVTYWYDLYHCFREWVCLEHDGWAKSTAIKWWLARTNGNYPVPENINDALARISDLKKPSRVEVIKEGKFDRITNYDFSAREVATDEYFEDGGFDDDEMPF